jgi:hypothetical protein
MMLDTASSIYTILIVVRHTPHVVVAFVSVHKWHVNRLSRAFTPNSLFSRDSVSTCALLLRLPLLSVLVHIDLPNLSGLWPIMAMEISKSSSDVVLLMREVSLAFPWLPLICPTYIGKPQSSRAVPSHLFACPEIKHSLIHQSQALPRRGHPRVVQRNARQWRSPLIRVTGLRVPVMSQDIARNKRSLMISERSC